MRAPTSYHLSRSDCPPEQFSFVFGDGLVTSVGDKHKGDRALFAKYFTQKKIETHLPVLCKQTLTAIEAVRACVVMQAV